VAIALKYGLAQGKIGKADKADAAVCELDGCRSATYGDGDIRTDCPAADGSEPLQSCVSEMDCLMSRKGLLIWFSCIFVLSLYSRWCVFVARADRCSLDGNRIVPVHQVDLMVDGRVKERFCCVRCAREWPNVPWGATWQVRDEMTGDLLDVTIACFVESSVVTVPSRRDRIHAFKNWTDAVSHVSLYGGSRIPCPFPAKAP
jgi:hypothetical protein